MKHLALFSSALLLSVVSAAADPTPPVPVTLAAVGIHDVSLVREGLGTVQALNTATIRVQVSGQLDAVAFKEGQALKKGDLIAQIDPRPFEATLDRAEAALARDKAVLANAKLNLSRTQPLATRGFATDQTLDTQTATVQQDESTLKVDEAEITAAKVQLDFTRITAPFDGVTGIRLVDVGNIVHPGDPGGLVVLTQVQPISVLFALPAADIPVVQAALAQAATAQTATGKGQVEAVAYGADDKTVLDRGTLLLINNQANPTSGSVQLKAQFPNAADKLWPGTFVNVHVTVGVVRNGTTVPSTAVQQGPDGLYVWVVGGDAAHMRPVTIEQSRDGEALVASGVKGGERVVASGQYGLSEGAKVAAVSGEAAQQVQTSTTASAGLLP